MAEVGIRELKQNASAVVARAAAGEVLTITDRGRPVARLTPLPSSRFDEMVASGRIRGGSGDLSHLPPPPPPRAGQPPLTEVLVAMRDEERY